jgi:hypothetical protein
VILTATREVDAAQQFLDAAVKEYEEYKESPDYVAGSDEDKKFESKIADLTATLQAKEALLESQRLANPNVSSLSRQRAKVGGKRRPRHPTLCARRAPSRNRNKNKNMKQGKTRQGRRRFSVGD